MKKLTNLPNFTCKCHRWINHTRGGGTWIPHLLYAHNAGRGLGSSLDSVSIDFIRTYMRSACGQRDDHGPAGAERGAELQQRLGPGPSTWSATSSVSCPRAINEHFWSRRWLFTVSALQGRGGEEDRDDRRNARRRPPKTTLPRYRANLFTDMPKIIITQSIVVVVFVIDTSECPRRQGIESNWKRCFHTCFSISFPLATCNFWYRR